MGHHFPSFHGLLYLPSLGPETLALLAHLMCPNRQEPLCSSDLKSHLLEVPQLDLQRGQAGSSSNSARVNWVLPLPFDLHCPPSLEEGEEVMKSWWDRKPAEAEAQCLPLGPQP